MRIPLAIVSLLPLLAACEAAGPVAAAAGASVAIIGRTPVDVVASLVTGRDCSVVRLDRRESYCAPAEQPPAPQPFCTRSLGSVDCWTVPPHALPPYQGVANGPNRLNAAQEADRTRWGPGLAAAFEPAAASAPPVVVVTPAPVAVVAPPPPAPVETAPVVRMEPIPNPPEPPRRPRARPRPAARPAQPACPCPQPAATPAAAAPAGQAPTAPAAATPPPASPAPASPAQPATPAPQRPAAQNP